MKTTSPNEALLQDVWQKIPPEDKRILLADAQSTAISTILILLMFGGSIAVGLKEPWFFWGTFLLLPFLFQVSSSKAWNLAKPKMLVQYTAARATACYYATQAHGHELVPSLQFRGFLGREIPEGSPEETPHDSDDLMTDDNQTLREANPVWVTLFPDSLVMFSEGVAGSRSEFAHSIFDDISLSSQESEDDMEGQKKLSLSVRDQSGSEQRFTLTSNYPASLIACERKLHGALQKKRLIIEQQEQAKLTAIKEGRQSTLSAA